MMEARPHAEAILHVEELSKRFGGVAAVDGCSLAIPRGLVTAIIGPNGAGKSTLMNLVGGLYPPDAGRIVFDGSDITRAPMHARAGLGLVRTFQISRELAKLTVFENLMLAGETAAMESPLAAFFGGAQLKGELKTLAERAKANLDRVGLFRLADDFAASLSGGQKKLLELSRALMLDPKLILLDEPAAGVAPPMVRELARVIVGLKADGITIGLVEHDMELVAEIADHVYVLAEGRALTEGTFAEVTADRRVVEAYLGGVV